MMDGLPLEGENLFKDIVKKDQLEEQFQKHLIRMYR